MPIIGTLPNNITNGQAVDANPVMADFNYIVNQVNANANPSGTLTAPSGTAVLFQQGVAPLGWTAQTTTNDAAIRVMTPANFVGAAGANAFSGLVRGGAVTDGHALSTAELAVHTHADAGHTHADAGHVHRPGDLHNFYTDGASATITGPGAFNLSTTSGTALGFANIQNGFANIQNAGNGSAHTHALTNFNYLTLDVISAVKA